MCFDNHMQQGQCVCVCVRESWEKGGAVRKMQKKTWLCVDNKKIVIVIEEAVNNLVGE